MSNCSCNHCHKKEKADHKHHDHTHHHEDSENKTKTIILIFIGLLLFVATYLPFVSSIPALILALTLISYYLVGHKIIHSFIKNIKSFQIFDENFLMILASIGALALNETVEALAVILLYQVGEFFQDRAVNKSRKSIIDLMQIKPDTARIIKDNEEKIISPDDIEIGDTIKVLPGEKIPLDGIVIKGVGLIDTAALTGESVPREVEPNSDVLSGSINLNSVLLIHVTKKFEESTVAKILELVENSADKKSKSVNFITTFSKYYTPVVVIAAALLAVIGGLVSGDYYDFFYRSLSFLVVSCPCALVISIPLSYFSSVGSLAKKGIMVKGSNYLDMLYKVKTIILDKTGTITTGKFSVEKIVPHNDYTKEEVLKYAAIAEQNSTHPIAVSITKAAKLDPELTKVESVQESSALGVKVIYNNQEIIVGSKRFMSKEKVNFIESSENAVYVAINKVYAGVIIIADQIKPDAKNSISALKSLGVEKIIMLTGDTESQAIKTAKAIGVDEYHSQLLPQDKATFVEKCDNVAFVGDGINDAPVITLSDVGIAMGAYGSESAVEASDIVLMNDQISSVVTAYKMAKRTRSIVWQNIIFSLGVKILVLLLSTLGMPNVLWVAVFADVGVALLAVLNAMRLLK